LTDIVPESERRQLAAERRKARHYAVQALYQWAISGNALADIEAQFREEFDFRGTDVDYFSELLHGVPAALGEIEEAMAPYLDIAAEKLGPVELAVLRMATYELRSRPDVPYRVVISEAIALTRKFGATDSHRFVNGVLDKVARNLREAESLAR
jgi:transcription antitermination protein NusB